MTKKKRVLTDLLDVISKQNPDDIRQEQRRSAITVKDNVKKIKTTHERSVKRVRTLEGLIDNEALKEAKRLKKPINAREAQEKIQDDVLRADWRSKLGNALQEEREAWHNSFA